MHLLHSSRISAGTNMCNAHLGELIFLGESFAKQNLRVEENARGQIKDNLTIVDFSLASQHSSVHSVSERQQTSVPRRTRLRVLFRCGGAACHRLGSHL